MLTRPKPESEAADKRPEEALIRWNEFVRRYRVCYEIWPEYLPVKDKRVPVGFELILIGAHEPGAHPEPGCELCAEILKPLRAIAEWILPKVERDSRYEVEIHDHAIQGRAQRKFRPEVTVSVRILHRQGFDQPVDACERTCLQEMEEKLKSIGVQYQLWNPNKIVTLRK